MNALRGHSNIQGATDMGGVFDIFPGYLKMPNPTDTDLATYLKRATPTASKPSEWDSYNYWSNTPKFMVSWLKAMFGDAAKKENDFAFHYLPKIDRRYSWVEMWDRMYNGEVKGQIAFGMNGVMIGPNSQKNIEALKKADWLVCATSTRRDERVLALARHQARRDEKHQDGSISSAWRGVRGKGRHVRQLRSLAAMEVRRAADIGRGESRSGDSRANLFEGARTLPERGRQVPGRDYQCDMVIHESS